jgi:hypothetical protein
MANRIAGVEIKTNGIMDGAVHFVKDNHLKDRIKWQKTVEVFETREDSLDEFWRGEFFGKQMRGAALVYEYTKDEEKRASNDGAWAKINYKFLGRALIGCITTN